MDEKITLDQLALDLEHACRVCAPDEYQHRQNILTRRIASYLLNDYYETMESNDE